MPERVLLAMSGGVESSVAALLLKQAGYDVIGLFMNFFGSDAKQAAGPRSRTCCAVEDAADARRVAARLSIPFYSVDLSTEFAAIRDNFREEYGRGRTPIPCTLCNRDVKFGRLLEIADQYGADRVATGHYAVRREPGAGGVATLHRGRSIEKDQTYFLWPLSGEGLQRALFPVGDLQKEEVRALATSGGLLTADKPESQDLCFVPDGDYVSYLRRQGVAERAGDIRDTAGQLVGRHSGIETVTVGQRRGLGIAVGEPRYVVSVDAESNTVVVGSRDDVAVRTLTASGASWLGAVPPAQPVRAAVKVRHTHTSAPATITALAADRFTVDFDEPVFGVAPGQAAVAYVDDRVLCGGWID